MRPGGGGRGAGPGIASPPGPRLEPHPDGPGPRGSQPAGASHPSLAQPKLLPLASGTPRIRRGIDAFELWCCRRLLRVPWSARIKGQCSGMREVQGKCAEADWGLGKTNPTPQTLLTVIP